MKHITDLTCCRALFAGWVFAYHLNLQAHYGSFLGPVGTVIERGNLGVDGFFILSGMVLAHAHPDLGPSINEARWFWAKRLVRIYPVHIAMIVALCAMIGGAGLLHLHPRDPERFSLPELYSHLALVHAWGFSDRWAWNYPSWSISAEWAGYLAFPYLWTVVRRQTGAGLAVILPLTFAGVAVCQYVAHMQQLTLTYDGGLMRFFPEFIAGMAIVPLLERLGDGGSGRLVALVGAAIVAIGAWRGYEVGTIVGLWCVLAGLMLAARQRRPPLFARLPALTWLGEISYSYYMSFALVETLQATIWRHFAVAPPQHMLLYIVTTTALTLGIATLSWRFVELPSQRAFSAFTRRRARRMALSTAVVTSDAVSPAARP